MQPNAQIKSTKNRAIIAWQYSLEVVFYEFILLLSFYLQILLHNRVGGSVIVTILASRRARLLLQFHFCKVNPPHKGPPWTIGGTLFWALRGGFVFGQ